MKKQKFSMYAMIPILVGEVVLFAVGVVRLFKSKRSHGTGTPVLGVKASDY